MNAFCLRNAYGYQLAVRLFAHCGKQRLSIDKELIRYFNLFAEIILGEDKSGLIR